MQLKPHQTKQSLVTAILRDTREFAALEEEWDELYRHSPRVTPFQSWAWLYSWWESYGEGHELRLVTVRDGDLLVGVIPLMIERRWSFGRLLFVGSGATDFLDLIAREGRESAVVEAGTQALMRMDSWQVADLQELRPTAVAWTLQRSWPGQETRLWQNNCPVTGLDDPWEELLKSLSKNHRKVARRSLRRAEEDGLRRELAREEDAEEEAKRLVTLHRESWRGRGIGLEHTTRRFERLLVAASRRMTARGLGAVSEFRQDGETRISSFLVFGQDFVGGYLNGATRESLERYQFSSLCIWDAVNVAHDKNLPRLSHLRGEEPYKLRWSSEIESNHRLILSRNRKVLSAYAGYRTLRLKAGAYLEAYVNSDNAPRWVRTAPGRAREAVIWYRTRSGKLTRTIKDGAKRIARNSKP